MENEDIRIARSIIHILDSSVGVPVLSDKELEHGSDFGDFLRGHILRIAGSDDIKSCSFDKEESAVYPLLASWEDEKFVDVSKQIAVELYQVMNANIDIPAADLLVVQYSVERHPYLALLKMNYKTEYTHMTNSDPWGNQNDVLKYKAILPGEKQKLSEAALISLEDYSIRLLEKKYEVNGVKTNYFSTVFLKCKGSMSSKTRLAILNRTVADVQKKYYDESEQFEVQMEAKSIISQELAEKGSLDVPAVLGKIFKGKTEMEEEVLEKLDKWNIADTPVAPQNPATTRKFEKQHLMTDTGIEIKIPMEAYDNKDTIEFITNPDGTISMLIKNIGKIESR
ncbi:nucleoid-associated protein [Hominisplanchenecus murintestinalis]|uniref:nucleoid-associated protein n=1 Tax=Hominisplanchenecus murintestinalis TaxID=2941517 RepID=UPI00203BBA0D|nr:nucleoid-associated protein [Hominisplanchenecus murintestinalis]